MKSKTGEIGKFLTVASESLLALSLASYAFGENTTGADTVSPDAKPDASAALDVEERNSQVETLEDLFFKEIEADTESAAGDPLEFRKMLYESVFSMKYGPSPEREALRISELTVISKFSTENFEPAVRFCEVYNPHGRKEIHYLFTYRGDGPEGSEKYYEGVQCLKPELKEELDAMLRKAHFELLKLSPVAVVLPETAKGWDEDMLFKELRENGKEKEKSFFYTMLGNKGVQYLLALAVVGGGALGISKLRRVLSQGRIRKRRQLRSEKLTSSRATVVEAPAEECEKLDAVVSSHTSDLSTAEVTANSRKTVNATITESLMPVLKLKLEPGQEFVSEANAMLHRTLNINMFTTTGKEIGFTNGKQGFLKRYFSGESIFFVHYTNDSETAGDLTLSMGRPGSILQLDLGQYPSGIYASNAAFFAADVGVEFHTHMFGLLQGMVTGRGVMQQQFTGEGNVYLSCPGALEEIELSINDRLRCDAHALFAWTPEILVEYKRQGAVEAMTNGEGLYLFELRGPGKVWMTSSGYVLGPKIGLTSNLFHFFS